MRPVIEEQAAPVGSLPNVALVWNLAVVEKRASTAKLDMHTPKIADAPLA